LSAQRLLEETSNETGLQIPGEQLVIIAFKDAVGATIANVGAFGGGYLKGTGEKGHVRLKFLPHPQLPCMRLRVDRGPGLRRVMVYIFATSLFRKLSEDWVPDVSFAMHLTDGELFDAQCLWDVKVRLATPEVASTPSAEMTSPRFEGMHPTELIGLRQRGDSAMPQFEQQALSPGERVIYGLLKYSSFSIYRPWQNVSDAHEVFRKFKTHFERAMTDCALIGNWPHYVRQANKANMKISDPEFNIGLAEPPREMVTEWRVKFRNKRIVAVKPEQWSPYQRPQCYPNAGAKAFAIRLALERSREYQAAALRKQFDGPIDASLSEFAKQYPGVFYVQLMLDKLESGLSSKHFNRPAINTRITITIASGRFAGSELSGFVQDDHLGLGTDLNAVVRLEEKTAFKSENIDKVQVRLCSDGTSIDQQLAAVLELVSNGARKSGIDLPYILLQAPHSIGNHDVLAQEVMSNKAACAAFLHTVAQCNLSTEQTKAARLSLESATGLLIIQGPPGTGKTTTILGAALAHISIGRRNDVPRRRILAVAPSNATSDNMARHFKELVELTGLNVKFCRFKGVQIRKTSDKFPLENAPARLHCKGKAQGDEVLQGMSITQALFERLDSRQGTQNADRDLRYHYFNNARSRMVHDIATGQGAHPTEQWVDQAQMYQTKRKSMWKAKGSEKAALHRELHDLERIWDERYFQDCDIVFCTNELAGHEGLMEFFKPSILISDDTGLVAFGNAIVPVAAHKETLKHIILAGDHHQKIAQDLSKGVNECYEDPSTSILQQLMHLDRPGDKVVFDAQRRLGPAHFEMVKSIWYPGELSDHHAPRNKSGLEVTLEHNLGFLGRLWNKRLRLAIPISGSRVCHEMFAGSRSHINRAEAEAVVDHVGYLSKVDPPPTSRFGEPAGRHIRPEDILVITPYTAQKVLIKTLLLQRNLLRWGPNSSDADAPKVEVTTTDDAQGREGSIVISS